MIVRARAPLRISFGGGGTDVAPYPEKYGGAIIGTTIDQYAYSMVSEVQGIGYSFKSIDLELDEIIQDLSSLKYNGKLDLAKAVVKTLCVETHRKFELSLASEAPPGSGLGSSSSLMVSAIRSVSEFLGMTLARHSLAELAYKLERVELGIKGGSQDQYWATFGGFNFMEFNKDEVVVNPLRIEREILQELRASLVLVDTGRSRLSSNILSRQIDSYKREETEVIESLHRIKQIAIEMKSLLLRGRLVRFGELLGEEWENKKKLDSKISNPTIEKVYAASKLHGALGGKILGAGDGGHMLLFVDLKNKRNLTRFLESNGFRHVPFNFDAEGVACWKIQEGGVLT